MADFERVCLVEKDSITLHTALELISPSLNGLHLLAVLGEVILAFVTHGLGQLVGNSLAFGRIDFHILAPLRHMVLVISGQTTPHAGHQP